MRGGRGAAVRRPQGDDERTVKVAPYAAAVNRPDPHSRVERALPPGAAPDAGSGSPERGRGQMSGVFKSIEMVGTSGSSFEDAVRAAVKRAGESMRDLEWMEVVEQRGYIR